MSDIISNKQYIQQESVDFNSPTSEVSFSTIGGTINWLLDKTSSNKVEYFPGSGTTTAPGGTGGETVSNFIIPTDANILYFWMIGGGGGGGGSDGQNTGGFPSTYIAGAGGSGSYHTDGFLPVTGGSTITVTAAAGGRFGAGNENGYTGGTSTISGPGVSMVARGNGGGERALDGGNNSFNLYQIGTKGGNGSTAGTAGFGSQSYAGGAAGAAINSGGDIVAGGGGGGSSPVAIGGAGGNGNLPGNNAPGYGGGGGGAGGDKVGGFLNGGNGAPGLIGLVAYKLG